MEENYQLDNKVLCEAFKKVLSMGKEMSTKDIDEIPNNYETALQVAQIQAIVSMRELIDALHQLSDIASIGILESITDEDVQGKTKERLDTHLNIIDYNNSIVEIFAQLIKDLLGEDKMQDIAMEVQLQDIL